MQKEWQGVPQRLIRQLIAKTAAANLSSPAEEDRLIEKYILTQVVPLGCPQDAILAAVKEALTDPELAHPRKYLPLLYLSLLQVAPQRLSDLFKFYYQLTSHAIRELRERGGSETFWESVLEKIYQYGMMLLVGSRSVLLSVESLGARVQSEICLGEAKQMRLGRIVKIYNCLLCIPERYLSLKQTLYLTLIFTRWQHGQPPFFTAFTQRTQKKLIRKLRRYPQEAFSQEHVLNLIKIVLGGDQLLFSHFLHLKYAYEALKSRPQNALTVDRSVFDALQRCPVIRESRHLFNFVIELVVGLRGEAVLRNVERQAILWVSLKYLSGRFENNEELFVVLVRQLLHQQNPAVAQLTFRLLRQESLQYLTLYKLKLLLNLFNVENWRSIIKESLEETSVLSRLQKVLTLLGALSRRYSESSLVLYCRPDHHALSIKQGKNIRSVILVVSFDGIGRLSEGDVLEMSLLRLTVGKDVFQITTTFTESSEALRLDACSQPKERVAELKINSNNKELIHERKQFIRISQGSFESLLVVSLLQKRNAIAFCIDGAYFEFPIRKNQVSGIEAGKMVGSVRTFYALRTEIQLVNFYKTWCEWNRKAKFVVESLGTQNIAYRLNSRQENPILDLNKSTGISFFSGKTEVLLSGKAVKHLTITDILLQLGGLKTIFFLLQRFSRSLVQLRSQEEKINSLIAEFFNWLRTVGVLDQSNALLGDLQECFKYLNEFLFLLIKRNRAVRESNSSFLLMSLFELLVYFRHSKHPHVSQTAQITMASIQASLVLKTLANFEIWSHCSCALQLFVLAEMEFYIRAKVHLEVLVNEDLHKQLLSALILFQTSSAPTPFFPEVQAKLISLCQLLYQCARNYILTAQLKGKSAHYGSYLERDVSNCFLFLKVLLGNCRDRPFSQSQRHAYYLLSKYLIDNFVARKGSFEALGKGWHNCASVLVGCISELETVEREAVDQASLILVQLASHDGVYDSWVLRLMEGLLFNEVSSFNDCLHVLTRIMGKYLFQTQRKHAIIHRILIHLRSKLPAQWTLQQLNDLQGIFNSIHPLALYHLSAQPEFYQLFFSLQKHLLLGLSSFLPEGQHTQQEKADSLQVRAQKWKAMNQMALLSLYSQKRITNSNQKFVSTLISNVIQPLQLIIDPNDSLKGISQALGVIREEARTCHNQQSNFSCCDIRGAFAIIQHCRGMPAMQFLMKKGLLTTQNDLNIPFSWESGTDLSSIGGTVGYYLSQPSSPLELLVLFTVILYRQLSNSLTILNTQANISIFQYAVQLLLDRCHPRPPPSDELWLDVAALVSVLADILKLLNSSFINKTAAVSKDIDRLLGPLSKPPESWKGKKVAQLIDNLSKASEKIQSALQDTKVDKDMSVFMDLIAGKLTLIQEKDQREDIMQLVCSLADDLHNKNWPLHEQQFKKLSILGIKFFRAARDYFLMRNADFIFQPKTEPKIGEKIFEISAKDAQTNLSYWNGLTERFQSTLEEFTDRGNQSQEVWGNLLISNEHWFELQEDLNDITTKFFELDEKETGPFGLYKLNIRPVRSDHQKLPYPRKKDYSEIRSQKERLKKEKEQSMLTQRLTIQLTSTNSNLFSTLAQTVSREKSLLRAPEQPEERKHQKEKEKEYFCEYVTKRGVYAGVLKRRKGCLEFRFMGHSALPEDRVYQTSTNKCHRIEQLSQWERRQVGVMRIRVAASKVFTRRYILRHTALELFHPLKHRSYFFNLFYPEPLAALLAELRSAEAEVIERRPEEFKKAGFTERWRRGQLSNFEYLGLVNRYSGRTTNDLAQYLVMPWVISNYNGQGGYREIDKEFYRQTQNMRDLSLPTGKLNPEKFDKLKARLREVDASDRQIRFLYGTIYSNPTVLYNFFIRLQPFTSLHWEHQGRKLDHADRLFSGIQEQFATILTSSSDMKELAPQFYYWTQFLRNRNRIDLGRKQKGEDVDAVALPVWARSPEEFIFKMREALQSNHVSAQLHHWIDLIFGYKSPIEAAEEHDNLYHYQCYEHDLFTAYETDNEVRIAQIAVSEFGQVAEQLFFDQHPQRTTRRQMSLDTGAVVHKGNGLLGFQANDAGVLTWSEGNAVFKKAAIAGLFSSFEWSRQCASQGKACVLNSVNLMRWVTVSSGVLRVLERGKVRMERAIQSKCFDCMGNYIFHGSGSKVVILEMGGEMLQLYSTLYGHRDEVILLKTDFTLDLILSVDRTGYVLLHELTELRFMRALQLGSDLQGDKAEHLRVCMHRMGYFLFLDHDQTLWIYNYMGELLLEQDIEIRAGDGKQDEEKVTGLEIFSHEHALILLSSSKGNIFLVNFLEMIRFRDTYPFKAFSRLGRSILSGVRAKSVEHLSAQPIRQFSLIKTVGSASAIYQLLVLYHNDELVCYSEQKEMGSQLQSNERLKSMGFF